MKKYICLLAILMTTHHLFAQTKKVYITQSGKYTSNSDKGVSYLLVQQLNGDSAYLAMQYDMHNNLLSRGTYKDEALNIPSGKFIFYKKTQPVKADDDALNADDKTYKATVGYFDNGKRADVWYDYSPQGDVIKEYTYQNNTLNGTYKVFNADLAERGEGTMVNGVLQGDFKWYINNDSNNELLASEIYYKNGKAKNKTVYIKPAQELTSLHYYLERKLRKYVSVIYDSQFTVKYNINEDGKITDAQIVSGYSPKINQQILAALADFKGYKPAKYNNEPVEQKYLYTFNVFPTDNSKFLSPVGNYLACESHNAPSVK